MHTNLVAQLLSIQVVSMSDRYVTNVERDRCLPLIWQQWFVNTINCTSKGALEGQIQSPREVTLAQCCSS